MTTSSRDITGSIVSQTFITLTHLLRIINHSNIYSITGYAKIKNDYYLWILIEQLAGRMSDIKIDRFSESKILSCVHYEKAVAKQTVTYVVDECPINFLRSVMKI